jgi:hypothetical protein
MNDVVKLLSNTDYDVQLLIGDILKPIREQQRKDAHKKMFFDTLDELDDLHSFYKQNRALHGPNNQYDGGCLFSFPSFLKYLDDYEGEGMTEDYFPRFWGYHTKGADDSGVYYKIRKEINRFLFQ